MGVSPAIDTVANGNGSAVLQDDLPGAVPGSPVADGKASIQTQATSYFSGSASLNVVPTTSARDLNVGEAWEPDRKDAVRHPASQTKIFDLADAEAVKRKVRATLLKTPYSVFDFYHRRGLFQFIGKHQLFENVTLGVIAWNAVWIAVETDWNKSEALMSSHWVFQVMEHAFCVYFTLEWFVRFMSFEVKRNGLKDGWFIFDSLLVFMMVAETWVLTLIQIARGTSSGSPLGGAAVLRLFRLLRLTRLMRMLRSLPELMVLIKGMVTAMKSVCYVMGLLIICTYVFAIAFTQLSESTEMKELYFRDVSLSMYSLIIHATFLDDLATFCNDILAESFPVVCLVFVFVCLSSMTVLNMLIGVLCEVITAVAQTEKEEMLTSLVSERMSRIVSGLQLEQAGKISCEEFTKIVEMPDAVKALVEVGVDPICVVDFADMLFMDSPSISFSAFMEMLLDLRGANTATLKDVMNLSMQLKGCLNDANLHVQKEVKDLQVGCRDEYCLLEQRVDSRLTEIETKTQGDVQELRESSTRIEAKVQLVMEALQRLSGYGAKSA
eukprot:TRINITY_DN5219_c0_g1_i1.p1 TRINITY_DN5219_c0_g1~~TRINITY_DN5219_c0_g1_i1.p1  ORF type:complete len:552 (-),score=133.78 TRINITY_DN5219_c0_g1_i1:112-1767(-)